MKKFFLLYISFIAVISVKPQLTVCSWNLENFGKSKTDSAIEFIADEIKDYDIVVIQEVVAGYGGAQAVAKLNTALNNKGFKWDYEVSNITTAKNPDEKERYAFLWKTSKVKLAAKPWLEVKYNEEICREPFFATFIYKNKQFTMAGFHAVPKAKQPETEIKYFKFLPEEYPDKNLIFCGDFNCPQSNTVFSPLKKSGYQPILVLQKTSLKEKCINNDCLASEYDNMFYSNSKITFIKSGIIPFYQHFNCDLKKARKVSDHVPIFFEFSLN